MKISRTHQRLSYNLNNHEVLTNPEPYLGPNWETVLRFWLYYDSFTYEQISKFFRRHVDIDDATRKRAYNLALNVAIEVIGENNRLAVCGATTYPAISSELIAMHLLLERGHQLTFVPLIKDL